MDVLKYALPLRGGKIREGLIIHSKEHFGEVSPLPGWSFEGALSFGLQSVETPFYNEPFSVPVAALLMGSQGEILEEAQRAKERGQTTAKLKIRGLAVEEAAALTRELASSFILRIDGNQCYSLEDAHAFCARIPLDRIEYFEEILKDPKEVVHFPYPVALDESLGCFGIQTAPIPHLKALIFKPTLRGGMQEAILFKEEAEKLRCTMVLSASFESGVGIFHIALLAKKLGLDTHPQGLGTYSYLEKDLLKEPLLLREGKLHLPKQIRPQVHC